MEWYAELKAKETEFKQKDKVLSISSQVNQTINRKRLKVILYSNCMYEITLTSKEKAATFTPISMFLPHRQFLAAQ